MNTFRFSLMMLLILFVANNAVADWYLLDGYTYVCKPDDGPAVLIKDLQELRKLGSTKTYKTTDLKLENKKPVIVKVTVYEDGQVYAAYFFKTKALCKEASNDLIKQNQRELDRYK